MIHSGDKGGVEEKKDDSMDNNLSPHVLRNGQSSSEDVELDDEQTHGFQAQWKKFADAVFGSCGSAIEAASYFVQQQGCRWPSQPPVDTPEMHRPPLSIAEELRKLAQRDGRIFQAPSTRPADIPKFLGEEAVYSFEDDNISALSHNTLEDMARHGVVQAQYARRRQSTHTPPSPVGTNSASTESSKQQHQKTDRGISQSEL